MDFIFNRKNFQKTTKNSVLKILFAKKSETKKILVLNKKKKSVLKCYFKVSVNEMYKKEIYIGGIRF